MVLIPLVGKRFVSIPNRPERLYGTPSLLFNLYRGSFPELKWPKRDDQSTASRAEVKNERSHTSSPKYVHGVDRNDFTRACVRVRARARVCVCVCV